MSFIKTLLLTILSLSVLSAPLPAHAVPTSGKIVFVSNRSGNYEIYSKDIATGAIVNLSNSPTDDMNPQLSPDGTQIVFYSDRSGLNQIYRMDLATKYTQRMTNTWSNDYDPSYMPDGRILYKSNKADGLGDIWLMNADGSNDRNLTKSMPSTEEWKPDAIDNDRIVLTSRRSGSSTDELYMLRLSTGVFTRLTNNHVPDWYCESNPAGTKIVFVSKEKIKNPDAIYTMNVNGTGRTKITNMTGDSADPSYSADGSTIAFVNYSRGSYDVYLMDANGGNVRLFESSSAWELSPIFVGDK
jgi:TolB protein